MNTAFSLANSVYSKLYSFAENFLIAVKPQLVKNYAAGNIDYMHRLMITSSQLGVYLMFILSLPVMLETHFIYYIWIGDIPDHTVWFLRIALLSIGVNTLGNIMTMSIQATGRQVSGHRRQPVAAHSAPRLVLSVERAATRIRILRPTAHVCHYTSCPYAHCVSCAPVVHLALYS